MLLLHIGRGKAGSSTIQNTIDINRDALQASGIAVSTRSSDFRGHAVDVYFGMQEAEEHRDALPTLRRMLDDTAHRHVFISSEFLFTATRPEIDRLKQAIGPHDLRIVVYLRDYPVWLRSLYGQGIKRGRRSVDFDAFYETTAKRASCRVSLGRWANAFGWERMRVRHLAGLEAEGSTGEAADAATDTTARSGLVDDLQTVIGCPLAAGRDQNTSPHWIETEFLRALHAHARASGAPTPPRGSLAAPLTVLRETIELHAPADAEYLTLEQHRRLEDDYLADSAWLAQRTDAPLPPASPDRTRERPFLPTLATAPPIVREACAKRMRRSLRLKEQPEMRTLVLATLAAHWPEAEGLAGDPWAPGGATRESSDRSGATAADAPAPATPPAGG